MHDEGMRSRMSNEYNRFYIIILVIDKRAIEWNIVLLCCK